MILPESSVFLQFILCKWLKGKSVCFFTESIQERQEQ